MLPASGKRVNATRGCRRSAYKLRLRHERADARRPRGTVISYEKSVKPENRQERRRPIAGASVWRSIHYELSRLGARLIGPSVSDRILSLALSHESRTVHVHASARRAQLAAFVRLPACQAVHGPD
jgi:hypothetical protein